MATDGRRQPIGMIHPRRSPWSLIAWALLLAGVATPASANLNLYLNQQEVRRLLGKHGFPGAIIELLRHLTQNAMLVK